MLKTSLLAALVVATTSATAHAEFGGRLFGFLDNNRGTVAVRSRGNARPYTRPPASYSGQWYTTPDGCSYSRANPPGGIPTWHLIQNPHHIGQPNAHGNCVPMM